MKKVLTMLVAIAALAAFAGSASAVTCTIDHKPSATLLLPYFQTSVSNASGSIAKTPFGGGFNGTDTLVTIVNASAADTLAHVTVWTDRSVPVFDFNVGLTGFDVLSWSMGDVLSGTLPTNDALAGANACALTSDFVRFTPTVFPTSFDKTATTNFDPVPQSVVTKIVAELDGTDPCALGGASPNFGANGTDLLHGYVTIDMVNFCTFDNPNDPVYWDTNAAGFENSFWGDYTIQSEGTTPTYGQPLVGLEADVIGLNAFDRTSNQTPIRTFYARYWETSSGDTSADSGGFNGGQTYFNSIGLFNPVVGDMREPLGITYGARYINVSADSTTFLRAWRASADSLTDLTGGGCTDVEPNVFSVIWDQDEIPNHQHGCQTSPCLPGDTFNFPFETQRENIAEFAGAAASTSGWLYVDFGNSKDGTVLDQAWLAYDFSVPGAFANAGIDAVSLDANTCVPAEYSLGVVPVLPEIPVPINADGITGAPTT